MWWSLWLLGSLPSAAAAPDSAWVETAIELSGIDGHVAPSEVQRRRLGAHCGEHALACAWAEGLDANGTPALGAAAYGAASLCGADAPVACLLHGWSLGIDPSTRGWRPAADLDGDAIRASLTLACDEGVPRACVELGWTEWYGIGTYVRVPDAVERWTALCDDDEAAACRALYVSSPEGEPMVASLERALELGDPLAAVQAVGVLEDEAVAPRLEAGCGAGVATACVALAREAEDSARLEALERGCATTDAEACARRILALDGSAAGKAEALSDLAQRWPRAATWAGLVARGAPLDPFTEPAQLLQVHQEALANDVRATLEPCYRTLLATRDVEGWYEVDVLTDDAGEVVAGSVHGDGLDEGFHVCAAEELRNVRPLAVDGIPRLAHARVSLAHTALLKGLPLADDVKGLTRISESFDAWAEELSRCGVGRGRLPSTEGMVRIKVKRTGEVLSATTVRSTEHPEVDACLTETLLGFTTQPLITGLKLDLRVRLQQPQVLPEPEPVFRTEPVAFGGEATPYRVLLLFVEETLVDGLVGRRTDVSEESVTDAFQEAAAFIETHTGGAVDVQVEARTVGGVVQGGVGDRRRGVLAWNVSPSDLPYEAVQDLERNTWDAILLWAPIPRGAPHPYSYVSWSFAALYGASVATSTLEEGRPLLLLDGTPASVLALQVLYDTWVSRAQRLLGLSLPPNDQPLSLGKGRRLEPRIGLTDDPEAFYRHVFYNHLAPDLWADMGRAMQEAHTLEADNLAFLARPVGSDGLRGALQLNDGLWEAGSYQVSAIERADPEEEGPRSAWVGLRWEDPQAVGRVRGRLHVDGEAPSLAVQVHRSGRWIAVGETTPDADGAFDLSWEGSDTDGVRIWLKVEGDLSVDELEAYAP